MQLFIGANLPIAITNNIIEGDQLRLNAVLLYLYSVKTKSVFTVLVTLSYLPTLKKIKKNKKKTEKYNHYIYMVTALYLSSASRNILNPLLPLLLSKPLGATLLFAFNLRRVVQAVFNMLSQDSSWSCT